MEEGLAFKGTKGEDRPEGRLDHVENAAEILDDALRAYLIVLDGHHAWRHHTRVVHELRDMKRFSRPASSAK
jgi:hypothetical protein